MATKPGRANLQSLADNAVTINGEIELYKGKPEIVISSAAQIAKE